MPNQTPQGNFTYVNERYCELTGRKPEKLLNGLGMQHITHPDDRARYAALLEKMFTAGEAFVMQKRYMRVDGCDVWVLDNVTPILDARDRVIGGTAASIDITERKQAEAALEKSSSELEKALQENEQARAEVEAASVAKDNFFLRCSLMNYEPRYRHCSWPPNTLASRRSRRVRSGKSGDDFSKRPNRCSFHRRSARSHGAHIAR